MSVPANTLEQLCEEDRKITYGVVKPGPEVEGGVLFVRGGDVFQGRIAESKLRTISPQLSEQYKRTLLRGGELLVSLVGNPGEVAVVPDRLAGANIARQVGLVPLGPKVNPHYVMHFLRSYQGASQLFSRTQGAVQQVINLSALKTVEIPQVSIDVQNRIASTLSAYDDLIENNQRRIKLLEQVTRLLYKEWFVDLRFPGHEHVTVTDGVPEGWEKGRVGDLAAVKSGFAFKSKDWQQEGNPVIKIKNIVGDGTIDTNNCDHVSDNVADVASNFTIPPGVILIAMTGATVGKIGLMPATERQYFLNQRVGLFKSKSDYPAEQFLFPFFQGGFAQTQVFNFAGGAAQPNISGGQIESIELLIPEKTIRDLYLDSIADIFQQRKNLLDQNRILIQVRDLLLPRVMNGKIAV